MFKRIKLFRSWIALVSVGTDSPVLFFRRTVTWSSVTGEMETVYLLGLWPVQIVVMRGVDR